MEGPGREEGGQPGSAGTQAGTQRPQKGRQGGQGGGAKGPGKDGLAAGGVTCYNCGSSGHHRNACPQPLKDGGRPAPRTHKSQCRNSSLPHPYTAVPLSIAQCCTPEHRTVLYP